VLHEIQPYLPFLARGLLVTLQITGLAFALAIPVSFVAGLGRMSSYLLPRLLAGVFIEVFRGTSALVQLFWFFYVLPFAGIEITPIACAVVVLGLHIGAYGAEVVRGAIQAVPRGQIEAATALGLSAPRRFFRVVLPQSIEQMVPAFGNLAIELLKATSVVSLITVSDLTFRAQLIRSSTGATTAVFTTILVFYFAVAVLISLAFRMLERRVRVRPPRHLEAGAGLLRLPWPLRRGISGA
jgi:polar amino acid transport system permease protein